VTTEHATAALREKGFTELHSLATWETIGIAKGTARLVVTAMPGKHGPGVVEAMLPSCMKSRAAIVEKAGLVSRIRYLAHGETYEFAVRRAASRRERRDLR
jgi:hypothetical protein